MYTYSTFKRIKGTEYLTYLQKVGEIQAAISSSKIIETEI